MLTAGVCLLTGGRLLLLKHGQVQIKKHTCLMLISMENRLYSAVVIVLGQQFITLCSSLLKQVMFLQHEKKVQAVSLHAAHSTPMKRRPRRKRKSKKEEV